MGKMLGEATRYEDRPNVFMSAMFRSGSTHIKVTLCNLLNYRPASTVISVGDYGNDSHQINHTAAQILFPQPAQVFHQHTLGTNGTQTLLKLYGLKPVIMYRNMLDSMWSLRELIATGDRQHLGLYYPPYWRTLSQHDQLRWLAYNWSNWYFTFYITWHEATELDIHEIWYDNFYADEVGGIRRILEHTEISRHGHVTDEVISKYIKPILGGRLNVGVSGRGDEIPLDVRKIIIDQARSWGPKWDGRLIGDLIER